MVGAFGTKRDLGAGAVYRRLARNSAYLAGGTAASALFMMLAAVLNARALSAREFGLLVLFQSATTMLAVLMSFSTQQPVIKLGSAALAERDLQRLGRIIGLGLVFDTLAAIAAAGLAFAFLAAGRGWVGIGDDQLGNAALFAGSLLFTGYLTANGIFRLLDRFALLSLIQAGCAAALLAVTAWLYASGAPFRAYCWTWAVFFALNGQLPLLVGLVLARRAGIKIRLAPRRMAPGEVPSFLAYCWTTWGVATIEALRSNGDSLLVGAMVSVEAAGVYNVAKQLAGVLRKANSIYASAMFPEVSALSAQGEAENARRVRTRILAISGLVGLVAVGAALLFGHLALGLLFGPRFELAYWPLVILAAAAAAQLISHTLSMYVQVYVSPERLFHVYLLAIVLFAIAVFPLTALLAMTGTAVAQLLFSLALAYFCHVALRRAGAA
jgi:O-antigen/teichoic acid export membrane protein